MIATPLSPPLTPGQSPEAARMLWLTVGEDSFHEGHFEQFEWHTDFEPACALFDAPVQISPIDAVKRHGGRLTSESRQLP